MTSKQFILILFGAITSLTLQAQTKLNLPTGEELKTKDDCLKYEPLMVEAANWLEETDLNKNIKERKEINFFVIQWLSLSATVSVEINVQLQEVYGKNEQLLGIYLASYARHFIENKSSATKTTATKAGLISMINVYKKGIDIIKSKEMEKLIKLEKANQLDEYINDKLK